MRLGILCAGFVLFSGLGGAQPATTPDLKLRGDRFKPLTFEQLTPEQKALVEHVLASERGALNGPFNVTLRSPEMGDLAQKLGAQLRFHSSLPARLTELAILITARFWSAQFEWYAHRKRALDAGLSAATIDAIAAGKRPTSMRPDEEIVYNFSDQLYKAKAVSDSAFKAVVDKFGERGAVDLTGIMGYYCFVSMMLNIDRYPLPEGNQPELRPIP